jgi:hypothetical protein
MQRVDYTRDANGAQEDKGIPVLSTITRKWRTYFSTRCFTNTVPCSATSPTNSSCSTNIKSRAVTPWGRAVADFPLCGGPGSSPVQVTGICGAQGGTAAGFLQVLQIPLPLIPPTAPHSSSPLIRPKGGRCANDTHFHYTQETNIKVITRFGLLSVT